MRKPESLAELCADIGFDAVDQEVAVWIEMGEYDEDVIERARAIGWLPPDAKLGDIKCPTDDRKLF